MKVCAVCVGCWCCGMEHWILDKCSFGFYLHDVFFLFFLMTMTLIYCAAYISWRRCGAVDTHRRIRQMNVWTNNVPFSVRRKMKTSRRKCLDKKLLENISKKFCRHQKRSQQKRNPPFSSHVTFFGFPFRKLFAFCTSSQYALGSLRCSQFQIRMFD